MILQERRGAAQRRRDEVADFDDLALGHDGAGVEPGHVQEVADEAVEPLGLAQRRAEKLVARRLVVAVAVAPEAGQRADDGGERRAQIVRHRGQHGRAQPLALGAQAGLVDILGQGQPLDGDGGLVADGLEQPALRGAELVARLERQHTDHADPGAAGADRHEQPAPARQGVGAATRRMVGVPRPAGRGEVGVAELAVGRKGGPRGELAIPGILLRHQDHDLGAQQPGKMGDHDPQQIVELDDARDLAAEGVELGGRTRLAPRRLGLRARARGERAGGDGHEHEENQRHGVGGIGDGEFVERRQEEEVEAEHAQPGHPERGHETMARRRHQHRHHEHQRNVGHA